MKYYRMSYEEVVSRRSYINIILLNKAIPSYNHDRDDHEINDRGKRKIQKNKCRNDNDFFMQFM